MYDTVLVIRHHHADRLGFLDPALRAHGLAPHYLDLFQNVAHPVPTRAPAALLVLGGDQSANDQFEYLRRERILLAEAIAAGTPILGICLGAQLLARTLGALVYRNQQPEVGWAPVRFHQEAAADPLFIGFTTETLFHWHGETFDLPNGAVSLASSDLCPHQAFRWGDRVYGFQFHLEATRDIIRHWVEADAACGLKSEWPEGADACSGIERAEEVAAVVFSRWGGMVKELRTQIG